MRTSTAYFAGVGTVFVAVAAGLGGGYLAANVANPPTQAVSKLERRMSAEPIRVSTAPAETVPNVAATTTATNATPAPAQEQPQQQQTQAQPQPQTEAAAPPVNNARVEEKRVNEEKRANNVAATQPIPSPPQPARPAEQASERSAAPQEAYAKARDADIKRAAAEQRRAERRQRWADQRRVRQPREQELEAVEARVREETEPRRIRIREEAGTRDLFDEPARTEMPRIRLFDQD
jgi:hypothetical protein